MTNLEKGVQLYDKLQSLRNFAQHSRDSVERNETNGYGSLVRHWEDVKFLLDLIDKGVLAPEELT